MGAIIQLFYFKTFLNILILVMTEVNNNSITVQSCVCGAHFLILAWLCEPLVVTAKGVIECYIYLGGGQI